ncbi:hypothetical protein VP1G_09378 [Cytospora mali]|uniref:Uncharacterized protein n=1 Tax=Cytospora mali TaxID=578113 RepID=A0A194VEQ2_CYTMA|nr:hypothetical protein VP1G_09378 [Valsa mali var. pyri (nom. inval.)]
MDQPTSPSARFYASRQNLSTTHWNMPSHPVPEHDPRPHYVPPFGHFQGFSAPSSVHQNMDSSYGTYGYHVPDGLISPRMPIPNFSLLRGSPQPRVVELSDDPDNTPQLHYQSQHHRVSGIAAPSKLHCEPTRPWAGQQLTEPSTQTSLPPEYSFSPEHTPVPAFAQKLAPMMLPVRGAPTFPAQPHPLAAKPRKFCVPSEKEEASEASIKGGSLEATDATLVAGDPDEIISVSSEGDSDSDSTVYPHDSVCTASSTTFPNSSDSSFFPDATRQLEAGVVEIHDICLAVTQRYLEALRVNWELRHGRDVVVPLGGGPVRHQHDGTGERGSPYVRAGRPGRWMLSEDDDMEYTHGFGLRYHDGGDRVIDVDESRNNHIPRPTDSLLQNTSYICDLMWRRALRDRDDVLGAETYGCRNMGLLFECAETVVLYDSVEWEMDSERGFEMICQAGRNLCRTLNDVEGMERVNDIEVGGLDDDGQAV